ncbi:thiopeptide-type bacteriocin biosynthesis protein [Streptomyces sp. NPDC003038]|uniref:thiopeptide-type bacteriocin biosynthesis protein n=1 Tax=unclassified Streptomyces TaxID=2593676 RepID=UPI00339F5529
MGHLLAGHTGDPEWEAVRDAFVAGGLAAVHAAAGTDRDWIQVGIQAASSDRIGLYRELSDVAAGLLDEGLARNFFFMHKPPGLRVRFQACTGEREALRARVETWAGSYAGGNVAHGLYEAESQLFGGPSAMEHAHRLFTHDSLAWLDIHGRRGEQPVASWAVSLLMLRDVLDALEIVGWEDRGVWELVRRETGRQLSAQMRGLPGRAQAAAGAASYWARPQELRERLPVWAQAVAERHRTAVLSDGERWRTQYFHTPAATMGPRRAAAFYTVFHWNRAALPALTQALLAEALADPADSLREEQ